MKTDVNPAIPAAMVLNLMEAYQIVLHAPGLLKGSQWVAKRGHHEGVGDDAGFAVQKAIEAYLKAGGDD